MVDYINIKFQFKDPLLLRLLTGQKLWVGYINIKFQLKDPLLIRLLNFSFRLAVFMYLFIYFHNTQCIVFELSLLAENQWHHDHSINQTLNSKQQQHWLKLSISELIPLSPFKKPKQICSTNWNQQF